METTPSRRDTIDVRVREVGPRDGLQMIAQFFPTAEKLAWIRAEADAGVREIEVASLVPAKVAPQFVDAAEVIEGARKIEGLEVMALVPNLRGAERAVELGVDRINFVMSVSRTHNLKNVRREREESLADFKAIAELLRTIPSARRPALVGGLSSAMGCAYEGEIAEADVCLYARELAALGANEILIADTVGHANPKRVKRLFHAVQGEIGTLPLGAHFHDTRGLGLANVVAALDCGVRLFDASLAGLGGCQFVPAATGNIVMDDLCFLLDSMGLKTGVDLMKLIAVREIVARNLRDTPLFGAVARAGLPTHYVSPAGSFEPAR
jgi:hydroxymethylglutaryl-CoA lyase